MYRHQLITAIKKIIMPFGEPYMFANKKLRFKAGTRPLRRKYVTSTNDIVRNDVLQINYMEERLLPDSVLWDIGSHHGHYSIFAASIASGERQVFSIEPDPDSRRVQKVNIGLNNLDNKITCLKYAISDSDGHLQFSNKGGDANSFIVKDNDTRHQVRDVECRTLNTLLKILPTPTFVKIDTEGAEISILKEADGLLDNPSIKFICELHPFAWKYFDVRYEQLVEVLRLYGRKAVPLDPKKSEQDLPFYGTVLF